MDRQSYYIEVAKLTSTRSTCRVNVGAVAVKDKRIIMTAYNGSPSGMQHCTEVGCNYLYTTVDVPTAINRELTGFSEERLIKHCIRTIHAEQNIITQCAKHGISLMDADIYCTHEPCMECQKLLISSGVKQVYYLNEYKDERLLDEYKDFIKLIKLTEIR